MPISNMVFTAHAGERLDLWNPFWTDLLMYQPPRRRFPGANLILGSGTFLLFESGKVVINGVRDIPDVSELESTLGIKLYDIKLSHMSAFFKMAPVKLDSLVRAFPWAIFEPEQHPGLRFKVGNVSVIIYATGSTILCGLRSSEQFGNVESYIRSTVINN